MQQGEVAVLLRLMERKFGHRLTKIDQNRMATITSCSILANIVF